MFHDLEILNKKNYRLHIEIEQQMFTFRWKEPTIREMLEISEQTKHDPDDGILERQTQLALMVFQFLHNIDNNFTQDHFKHIKATDFQKAIELIMNPLYGDKQENGKIKAPKNAVIRFTRQMMFLMKYSNGAFTHESIMNLTFSQFFAYNKALSYVMRSESKEGQQQNEIADKKEELRNTDKKDIDKIRDSVEKNKEKWKKFI